MMTEKGVRQAKHDLPEEANVKASPAKDVQSSLQRQSCERTMLERPLATVLALLWDNWLTELWKLHTLPGPERSATPTLWL